MWAGVSVAVLLSLSFGACDLRLNPHLRSAGSHQRFPVHHFGWLRHLDDFLDGKNARMLSDELKGKLNAMQTNVWAINSGTLRGL